ncbi:folylpolyglutamate synthase/dihydrofolate synthase [Idiomarina sp. A28L]|nr:folylpolyglutamate synthase/dihydrofolate synthase [Idiomarina sp. A28L]
MQAQWSLQQWLEYLESIHHRPIDMGLERVRVVAENLQLLAPDATVFTVGGTNGKGSTVRYLEQICLAAGLSVATYTSPHMLRYTERVRFNGAELPESEHVSAFCAIEEGRKETSLTYFEFGTLAAIWLCQQHSPQVIILEVGLGGRFDAVNIIDADVSVVTSVGIDHIEFLGSDREQIGFEKAGIYRPHKPAVCGDPAPPLKLVRYAEEINAPLFCVGKEFSASASKADSQTKECFDFQGPNSLWQNLPMPTLPFANALTALAALQLSNLNINSEHAAKGLQTAQLEGRFETVSTKPTVIFDVGHNPHAAQYLAQSLQTKFTGKRIVAVCGMLKDKEHSATLAPLLTVIDHWYLASLHGARGVSADVLRDALPAEVVAECFSDPIAAFTKAKAEVDADDVIVCFGSFLTVAALHENRMHKQHSD